MRADSAIVRLSQPGHPWLVKLHHPQPTHFLPNHLLHRQRQIDRVVPVLVIFGGSKLAVIPMPHLRRYQFLLQLQTAPQSHQSTSEHQPSGRQVRTDEDHPLTLRDTHQLNQFDHVDVR